MVLGLEGKTPGVRARNTHTSIRDGHTVANPFHKAGISGERPHPAAVGL
jgi:hypothetical protein